MEDLEKKYLVLINRRIRDILMASDAHGSEATKTKEPFSTLYKQIRSVDTADYFESNLENPRSIDVTSYEYMLDPGYEFFENPSIFSAEFKGMLLLMASTNDPRLGLLAMKACFQAGKIIAQLENDGVTLIDRPFKAGSSPKKNRYSDQEIIEAFYRCNGKNLHAMAVEIEAFLDDHKKRTKNSKNVPSISTIKRVLKKDGLDKKLSK